MSNLLSLLPFSRSPGKESRYNQIMFKNTKQSGELSFFVYRDPKEKEFVGFCLELGIIKEGDDFDSVRKDLVDASFGYIMAVNKNNMSDELLNQPPPKEYLDLFKEYLKEQLQKVESPKKKVTKDRFECASVFTEKVGDLCLAA